MAFLPLLATVVVSGAALPGCHKPAPAKSAGPGQPDRYVQLLGVPGDQDRNVVSGAGDLDGDGLADVAVGIPERQCSAGGVAIWWGRLPAHCTNDHQWIESPREHREPEDWFGASVAAAGDVDGDGFGDLVVGAPLTGGALGRLPGMGPRGAAYVYAGSRRGVEPSPVRLRDPEGNASSKFGMRVAGIGDANGDGFDEVAVADSLKGVLVYPGGPDGIDPSSFWRLQMTEAMAEEAGGGRLLFGHRVAGAGDVNGDGFEDLVVGAILGGSAGVVYLGGPDGLQRDHYVLLPVGEVAFPEVVGPGDVDGDGFDDVLVGRVLFLGGPDGPTPERTRTVASRDDDLAAVWEQGPYATIAGAGDTDGDGRAEVLLAAPQAGLVALFEGSLERPSWVEEGPHGLGFSVAGVGDHDGDGLGDIALSRSWPGPADQDATAELWLSPPAERYTRRRFPWSTPRSTCPTGSVWLAPAGCE